MGQVTTGTVGHSTSGGQVTTGGHVGHVTVGGHVHSGVGGQVASDGHVGSEESVHKGDSITMVTNNQQNWQQNITKWS